MRTNPPHRGRRAVPCALVSLVLFGGACRSADTEVDTPGEVRPAPAPSAAALVAEGDRAHARGDDATAADRWQRALLVDRALAGRLAVPARLANLASRSGALTPPPHLDAGSIHSLFDPDGGAP